MTLQELYKAIGADYDEVLGRLRSERLIQKFTLRFPDDGSFDLLCHSLEEGNYEEAFRAAHTIKGTPAPNTPELLDRVRQDYRLTVDAIRAFQADMAP